MRWPNTVLSSGRSEIFMMNMTYIYIYIYHDIKHTTYFNIDINNFHKDELNIYSVMQYIENYVTTCLRISFLF